MTPLSCDMVSNVCLFRNDVTKTESRKECNRLFDRDPSTSWIQITNDNLCFGQAAGGIDACQVKKCFVCQVITSNIHCWHILKYHMPSKCHDEDRQHMIAISFMKRTKYDCNLGQNGA